MYGYYDKQSRRSRFAKIGATGLGIAAFAAAVLNRERVTQFAERTLDSVVNNATVQQYATETTKFALDSAESFQNVLHERLKNNKYFQDRFAEQGYVDRTDHLAVGLMRENLPRQEWEYKAAGQMSDILSRVDTRTNTPTWSNEKIESLLENETLFRTLLHNRGASGSELPNILLHNQGAFQDILRKEAEAKGTTFEREIISSLGEAHVARAQIADPPKRNDPDIEGILFPQIKNEFSSKLEAEVKAGPDRLEKLTGFRVKRVNSSEAKRLRDNYTPETVDTSRLARSRANAEYEMGEKQYNFSAYRNIFLSSKDFVSTQISVPLSLFQQGISIGQLFQFVPRMGSKPLLGVFDEGFRKGFDFQVFFGKKLINMTEEGSVSVLPGTYNFQKVNQSHIKNFLEAQSKASTNSDLTKNIFSKAYNVFRSGLGEIEPGTTPYWDKIFAFFRKFNAKDYKPNLLRRAANAKLESMEDVLQLSKILRQSSLKLKTEDLTSLIDDLHAQKLTKAEAYGTSGEFPHGTSLIRTPSQEETQWALGQRYEPNFTWPRSIDEGLLKWSQEIQQGEGSEYAKYSRAYDSMHNFLGRTYLPSPKLSRIDREMYGLNQGDRERFLAQTASYADSRPAEKLLGLDFTKGADRVTNLDILRGEIHAGLLQISQDENNTYADIAKRSLDRGGTNSAFLAQSFKVDSILQNNTDAVTDANEFLKGEGQSTLRKYLEQESRNQYSFLHVHPKTPKEEGQFGRRQKVIAIRTDKQERDGFLGLSRTWRAYTSPTSFKDQDTTQGSLFSYFILDRLHNAFREIGIGLPAAARTSPVHMALGLVALRYIPIFLGIPEAHKFINRVTRDVPILKVLNPDLHRANVLDAFSRLTHRGGFRRKALALIPGLDFYTDDRSQSDEDRAQRGPAYTPVRKGRWWAFGSREAFFGEKISYYAPSAARIARSDWQAATNVNRNNWQYWKHFGGYLNPTNWGKGAYWQEEANRKDRPYLQSGPAFDPGHPWSAPLNSLFGWILKPRTIYHPEYLPKHLGGTLEDQVTTDRPTSPFHQYSSKPINRRPINVSQIPNSNANRSNSSSSPLPASGHSSGGSGAAGASGGNGGNPSGAYTPKVKRKLPPGYVERIPRPHRVRDAQYDPLLDRINLVRDIDNKNRLTKENGGNMSPEEAAYIRSIKLPGGIEQSLYHVQEISGLYGWFGSLARPQIGHPVGKLEVADASRAYGRERRFYDQEIGGIGGNLSDVLRRFLPHRRRSLTQYDPVPNRMPTWMPGSDNLINFKQGDPFTKVPLGEMRLPGAAYERLHPGTTARMFRLRASSIGKSQAEMESFLVKKEGDGRAGAAAEMGTKMHRVLQDRWRKLGIMEADEVEVFDPKLNVTGHIDAILRIPDKHGRQQRVIADIKTKTAKKYAEVVRTNKPEDENLDQLLFYMQATGIKKGLLTYVNREDVRQVHQIEVKFDPKRFQVAVNRMEAARSSVKQRIREGSVSPGELYDPLTKYEILADVAPRSFQFGEMQKWALRAKEAMSQEDQKRLEDTQGRLKRQKGGFELHPYRFHPKATQKARVQVDKFVDRQTFVDTSGQTYKIAGINAEHANRLDTLSNDDWWKTHTGLRQGSHVTVTSEVSSAPTRRVISAAVTYNGKNVGRELLRNKSVEEDREDYSAPSRTTRFTSNELLLGRAAEFLLHQNNPVATKFFPVRSGLEQYERTDVFGKKSASWESPVSSYIWPTLASFTNKNPIAAAGMGAILGGAFFALSENRVPAMKIGALLGVAISIFGMTMRAVGKPFIPLAVQRRRKMDTYYDNLTYVKYRRLAAQEENLAHRREHISVNDLESDNLQNVSKDNKEHVKGLIEVRHALEERRTSIQNKIQRIKSGSASRVRRMRNQIAGLDRTLDKTKSSIQQEANEGRYPVGPHALQSLLYRQRYRATMRGALESGSWEAALSALPKPSRTAIVDVINNGSTADKRKLFSILPKDQKAVMGYALGIDSRKIPKMQELPKYFAEHPLPTADWEGWRSDSSLDLIKARDIVTGNKHLDPMDFGIFPSTVETAQQGSPEASIDLPSQSQRYGKTGLQQSLTDLLVGHGISGVRVEITDDSHNGESHEADVDMQVSQRREHAFFHGFKRQAQKGAFNQSS